MLWRIFSSIVAFFLRKVSKTPKAKKKKTTPHSKSRNTVLKTAEQRRPLTLLIYPT